MKKPVAVLISDVHYNMQNLELSDKAVRIAMDKATQLQVPLIVAGDLHDTKAMMRAECVNAMLTTFTRCNNPETYIIVGNHCRINEKSPEHGLNFLHDPRLGVEVISDTSNLLLYVGLYAYQNDLNIISNSPYNNIICHQGFTGADMGHYMSDPTALTPEMLKGKKVISGHYHKAQKIEFEGGSLEYIGNPFTMSFGEANDPPKGYAILNNDFTLTRIPLNFRKHIVIELNADTLNYSKFDYKTGDLVRVDVTGSKAAVESISRAKIAQLLGLDSFKMVLKPTKLDIERVEQDKSLTPINIFDNIIDRTKEEHAVKEDLKTLYRTFL